MATVNVSLVNICSGGGHLKVSASVNGGAARVIDIEAEKIISQVSPDDIETFLAVLLKIHAIGKTKVQVRDNLIAGLAITI